MFLGFLTTLSFTGTKKRVKFENTSRMGPARRTWVTWDREKIEKTMTWEPTLTEKEAKDFWFGEEKFCRTMVLLGSGLRGFSVSQAKNISDVSSVLESYRKE